MKRAIFAAITCCAIAGMAMGADSTPAKKATPPAKTSTAPKVAATKAGAKPATGRPAASTASRTPAKTNTRTTRRYYGRRSYTPQQMTPTADRYREIQDALAAKGYLKTPATGVWDKDSVEAMQRFQQDQKLEPTGKLTAKSLAALGLGSKTAGPVAANPPAHASGETNPLQ